MAMELDASWVKWIDTNIQRGCTNDSMLTEMVKAGFAEDKAHSAILTRRSTSGKQSGKVRPCWAQGGNAVVLDDRVVRVRFSCEQPKIALLDDVLSAEEAAALIALAAGRLSRSEVVDPETGANKLIAERSSDGGSFQPAENPWVDRVERRVAAMLGLDVSHAEPMQFLRYRVGGEYRPHFDFFPPHEAGSQAHLQRGGQRVATAVLYLSDVFAGGSTIFPNLSVSVHPAKGSAVFFLQHDDLGLLDERTLHGGAPVVEGEKWIVTLWFREGLAR